MDTLSPSMCDLARRLLALEAKNPTATDTQGDKAVRVCEKLRMSLTRFAGADGFTALLGRALALARADDPSLQTVKVTADGCLEGFDQFAADNTNVDAEAAIAIITHLLGLLATFIGEPFTLRLVREAWPEASLHEDF